MRKKKPENLKAKPVGITTPAEFVDYIQLTNTSPSKKFTQLMAEEILGVSFKEFTEAYSDLVSRYTPSMLPLCLEESAFSRFVRTARWMLKGELLGVYVHKSSWGYCPKYYLHVHWVESGVTLLHTVDAGIEGGLFDADKVVPPVECLYSGTIQDSVQHARILLGVCMDVGTEYESGEYESVAERGVFDPDYYFQVGSYRTSKGHTYSRITGHLDGNPAPDASNVALEKFHENTLVTRLLSRWVELSYQRYGVR